MSEQRRFPRKQINVEFRVREVARIGRLSFDTVDLSVGGAFLESEVLFEEGEPLELELQIPGTASTLRARARVAWIRRIDPDGATGMGVQFEEMSAADRQEIERLLARVP